MYFNFGEGIELLDVFFTIDEQFNRGSTEFGGIQGKMHGGFLPTGETALFLIAGNDFFPGLNVSAYLNAIIILRSII